DRFRGHEPAQLRGSLGGNRRARSRRPRLISMPAPREVVLLSGKLEARPLAIFLLRHNPELIVTSVETRDELLAACRPPRQPCRLVAFCTATIVPGDLLRQLPAGAYNFHPGPPDYPGRHPASFAIYEGAARFGATAHEITGRVDNGPI